LLLKGRVVFPEQPVKDITVILPDKKVPPRTEGKEEQNRAEQGGKDKPGKKSGFMKIFWESAKEIYHFFC
jgi:hypothetical protein